MKIINPSVEIMRTGLETEMVIPSQFIEKVGRTCYKSEDKITSDSAAKFVGNLIKRGHEAMIEHWNLIFKTDAENYEDIVSDWEMLLHNGDIPKDAGTDRLRPYLRFTDSYINDEMRCIISGNMRTWRDFVKACISGFGFIPRYLQGIIRNYPLFFPEFQDYVPAIIVNDILIPISVSDLVGDVEHGTHHDVTVKFICDRGVSHEIVRHRVASFAQESTRYCNYSGDKFDQCITVVEPEFIKTKANNNLAMLHAWERACAMSEAEYFKLLELGATPQEARSVLPNSLKTEVIVTMNLYGWDHFFGLRCEPAAHPDMQVVAKMAKLQFVDEGLV